MTMRDSGLLARASAAEPTGSSARRGAGAQPGHVRRQATRLQELRYDLVKTKSSHGQAVSFIQ